MNIPEKFLSLQDLERLKKEYDLSYRYENNLIVFTTTEGEIFKGDPFKNNINDVLRVAGIVK